MKKALFFFMLAVIAICFSSCRIPEAPNENESGQITIPTGGIAQTQTEMPIDIAEITRYNVKEVLESISQPESYTWNATVAYSGVSGERTRSILIYKSGDNMRCDITEEGDVTDSIYKVGGFVYIVDNGTRRYNSFEDEGGANALVSIAEFSDVVSLSDIDITSAYQETRDGHNVIVALVSSQEYRLEEEYVISSENGIPLSIESNLGETTYTLTTVSLDTQTQISSSVFALPSYVDAP